MIILQYIFIYKGTIIVLFINLISENNKWEIYKGLIVWIIQIYGTVIKLHNMIYYIIIHMLLHVGIVLLFTYYMYDCFSMLQG